MGVTIVPEALQALELLHAGGYEGWLVGGCVRDYLCGVQPHDYDICTSARPEQIMQVFKTHRTILTGAKHGTVTVLINGLPLEITTYRLESGYSDSRRPDAVAFTNNLESDLSRRDFTMNAIAWNPALGFRDPFGGQKDIEARVIRCVGSPAERFSEDALRMLRAVRFEAQLGFRMDTAAAQAIRVQSGRIALVSRERIREELSRILLSERAYSGTVRFLELLGAGVFPGHTLPCPEMLELLTRLPANEALRYAGFLHGMSGPLEALLSLRCSKLLLQQVKELLQSGDAHYPSTQYGARMLCREHPEHCVETVQFYDAVHPADGRSMLERVEDVLRRGDPFTLSALAVDGKALLGVGVRSGRELGRILSALLDWVLEDPTRNQPELLLEQVKRLRQTG